MCLNISIYWLDLFGKYFLLTHSDNSKSFSYGVISLSPIYLKYVNSWLDSLEDEIVKDIKSLMNENIPELIEFSEKLEEDDSNETQRIINKKKGDDIYTFYLPLVSCDKKDKRLFGDAKSFGLKGPLGFGLGFKANTTNNQIFFVKNQGILPLLDFLEFLTQRAIVQYTKSENKEHPVFHEEYFLTFMNEINFFVYWEITSKFIKQA